MVYFLGRGARNKNMSIYQIGAILLLAAAIHASFQLSVSMMTLMSGHALGKKTSHARVMHLMRGFIIGSMVMIVLALSFIALLFENLAPRGMPLLAWSALSGLSAGVGVAVWVFYYRHRHTGTVLWLPRPFANYLSDRARKTKLASEAFGLGIVSIVAELLFAIAPLTLAAALLRQLDTPYQLAGLAAYAIVASIPLLVIYVVVGGGRSLARVQRWREANKRFLQFAAGSALVLLGGYVYVEVVMAQLVMAGGLQ